MQNYRMAARQSLQFMQNQDIFRRKTPQVEFLRKIKLSRLWHYGKKFLSPTSRNIKYNLRKEIKSKTKQKLI